MDAAAHYHHLVSLGRDEFLAAAAPGVLVRRRVDAPDPAVTGTRTLTLDDDLGELVDETMPPGEFGPEPAALELYPLVKKPGASFPDRITIGRTPNNDVVIAEHSVSRLHAYVRGLPGARAPG